MTLIWTTLSTISYHDGEPFSMPVSMKSSTAGGACRVEANVEGVSHALLSRLL